MALFKWGKCCVSVFNKPQLLTTATLFFIDKKSACAQGCRAKRDFFKWVEMM